VKSILIAPRVFFVPFISFLFLGIVIWKLPALAVAQSAVPDDVSHDTPGQVIKQGQSVHIDVELALVNVTVKDPYDRLVTGLEPDNFRIFENSVEQEIQYFSSEDVPISIGVIFDLSGSMANKVGKAREAALQFFKTANPQDEFFLVSFNERAELMSAFTNSVEDLQSRIISAPAKGRTALLDAIYLGLSEMKTARNAKRALLIIPTEEITIVATTRRISSGWCVRRIPSCTRSAYLIHSSIAAERQRNSAAPRCSRK
jgi:VWFA-related protein